MTEADACIKHIYDIWLKIITANEKQHTQSLFHCDGENVVSGYKSNAARYILSCLCCYKCTGILCRQNNTSHPQSWRNWHCSDATTTTAISLPITLKPAGHSLAVNRSTTHICSCCQQVNNTNTLLLSAGQQHKYALAVNKSRTHSCCQQVNNINTRLLSTGQ